MKKTLLLLIPFLLSAEPVDLKEEIEFLKQRIKKLEEMVIASTAKNTKADETSPEIRIKKLEQQLLVLHSR